MHTINQIDHNVRMMDNPFSKPTVSPETIISIDQNALRSQFYELIRDSSKYELSTPISPPQFLAPGQNPETIAVTASDGSNSEFYVDKMIQKVGNVVCDPVCRIWARSPGTWEGVVKSMDASLMSDEVAMKELSLSLAMSAPAILLEADMNIQYLFNRLSGELKAKNESE